MLHEVMLREEANLPAAVLSLEEAASAAGDFAKASKSQATLKAYQADFRDFSAWCSRHGLEPLPASVAAVAAYLAAIARTGLRASTITRRTAAIRFMHRAAGLEPPTNTEAVKATLAGIRRSIGTAVNRKTEVTAETIRAMIDEIPNDLRGLRDNEVRTLKAYDRRAKSFRQHAGEAFL
jgi:site-specific recombinase XerD